MLDTFIQIFEKTTERDALNKRLDVEVHLADCWAQRTEHGGRENMYASRIVNQGEVVYTVRWRADIRAGQIVGEGERRSPIQFVEQEGRRKWLHLKCLLSNANG